MFSFLFVFLSVSSSKTSSTALFTTFSNDSTTASPKVKCPEDWIDAQDQGLGCLLFLNQTELSFFASLAVCEDNLGFSIELLSKEEAIVLYEMAEIAQMFTGVSQWWIGLSDLTHEGSWQWIQSSSPANLELYREFFTPQNTSQTDDCVVMTIIDKKLQWRDIDCMATQHQEEDITAICQCKGTDCPTQTSTTPATTTDQPVVCTGDWIDAGELGCIQFMPEHSGVAYLEAKQLCEENGGFLVETKTTKDIEFVSTLANVIHSYTPDIDSWWIGLLQAGVWYWATSEEKVDDDNWADDQPDGTDVCAILTRNTKGEYKWDDVDCKSGTYNGREIALICQERGPNDSSNTPPTDPITNSTSTTNPPEPTPSPQPWPEDCMTNPEGSSCYIHVATKSSWAEAEQDCVSKGGHLASSLSEEENNFLGENVVRFENVWIGGTEAGGAWAWSDSETWDYDNWKTGEPSGGACTYFNWQTYKWISYECNTKLKYVCKFI